MYHKLLKYIRKAELEENKPPVEKVANQSCEKQGKSIPDERSNIEL